MPVKRTFLRTACAFPFLIAAFALLFGCSARVEEQSASAQTSKTTVATAVAPDSPKAQSDTPFPVPVIEISGDGAALGESHGRQLHDQIRELHTGYLARYFRSDTERTMATSVAGVFETRLLPEHRDEVHALADGADVDEPQMMLAQCFLDMSPMTACSTLTLDADASPDGIARFGRDLDFASFNIADRFTVVMIVHPTGKNAFASIGWPGMVGVLSGMNEHGLALANMEVTRPSRLPIAMPYVLLYRSILENCRTVDEAISYLEKTPRQTANNLMLMDASGGRAVAEITPQSVRVRRGTPGKALISTNHQRGTDDDTAGRCPRYDVLHTGATAAMGHIDVTTLQQLLKSSSQGNDTLQSMIFEPSTRVLYLSAGKNAAAKPFSRLDLAPLFAHDR